ncbi:MAG: lysophospholipid acyltransferase family protein [Christensenellales bacterium]|jgi:1-acyl-sn-glycerol-3-phosphate acyltransferase
MLFYKIIRFILRPVIAILFPTKVIHKDNFPKTGKAVVISNHYSTADSLVIGAKLLKNSINCVAKKEAFSNKFVGWLFTKLGAISVDRDAPGLQTHKKIMNVLNNDDILLIFPEGTRNKAGTPELAPLKPGAALYAIKGKAPLVPMLYHHKHKMFKTNYLIVGKPFTLERFYDKSGPEVKQEATDILTKSMNDLRIEIDAYVENKNKGKKS